MRVKRTLDPRMPPETELPSALYEEACAYIDAQGGGEGLFPTAIESVSLLRSFETRMPMRQIYRPSLCIVLQGGKELMLEDRTLQYGPDECLVVSLDIPASGRIIQASPDAPYLGLTIDLDLSVLRDVLIQLDPPPEPAQRSEPCLFVAAVSAPLKDCVLRAIRLAQTPEAASVLFPALMREICYWLLTSPNGGQLRNLALPESNTDRIARAIRRLHADFAQTLKVETLAEIARMSPSSFHQHFKALTAMTPLQYQKQLRLLEARRLMVSEASSVSDAAYQVGYESPSQFSREYNRMFGRPPKQDALRLQHQYQTYASRKLQRA